MANCVWDELGLRIAINCQCNGLIEIQKSNIFRGDFSDWVSILFFIYRRCKRQASQIVFPIVISLMRLEDAVFGGLPFDPRPRIGAASPGLASSQPRPGSEVSRPGTEREVRWGCDVLWPPALASHPHRHSTQRPPCCQQTNETVQKNIGGLWYALLFLKLYTGCQFGKRRHFPAHVTWSYLDILRAFKISPKSAKILISNVFRGAKCSIYIFPTLNLHQSLNNIFPL